MNIEALNFVNRNFQPVYYTKNRRDCIADKFIYYKKIVGRNVNGFHEYQYLDGYSIRDEENGKYFLYKKRK
jgi:hypothetical protein